MDEHDHSGHRDRMRERFAQNGLDGFAPHEVLELLLFYAIPRRNVNPLAHKLIKHFGSTCAVFEATREQLLQVPGIGEHTASLLGMIFPLARYADRERSEDRPVLTNYRNAKAYCKHLFAGKADEVLYVICLDAQGRVLRAVPAITGTIDEIVIYPRKIVTEALNHKAHGVVLAHNHPSGVCEPSDADIETTETLRQALATVDIPLLDHMVYAEGECVSIQQWKRSQGSTPAAMPQLHKAADKKQAQRNAAKKPQEDTDA